MSDMSSTSSTRSGILVEAEEFDDLGGWVMDSQFELQMGSPYLLAHGLGTPVADATTEIVIEEPGLYEVWVRAKDWVPSHSPGRFTLAINGSTVGGELGANGQDWSWQSVGNLDLPAGSTSMILHDLTGFDGRCDAIFLSCDGAVPVDGTDAAARAWRRGLRGLPAEPTVAGDFDVVIVGGGVAGCVAALSAGRRGSRVALIQDRPYLGGNASKEIGLSPRGENGGMVAELSARTPDGDLVARRVLEAEPTISVFTERRVVDVMTNDDAIVSIDVREAQTGGDFRFTAPIFVDTTGTAILGLLAGAEILSGREGRNEFGEYYAPSEGDDEHHGNTVFFRTKMADEPSVFPDVPWATEISKDYANLSGQLTEPGIENGAGPAANADSSVFEFNTGDVADNNHPVMQAFPATHFWEYGQFHDLYTEGEHVRDYLLRALYGTFSNVKRLEPETFANLAFDWVAFVPAQGEFNRYKGDYVLTENDVRAHTAFPDAVVQNDGAFCIHIPNQPGEGRYDFRLKDWVWDVRDNKPYAIPFRCLYSTNISNLMMAGKHISVTRIAGTTTKLMGNGGQHGAAVGAAASLCIEHGTTPRGIYESHLDELQQITQELTGCEHRHTSPSEPTRDLTARDAVERHANDVQAGNTPRLMEDFVGSTFMNLRYGGSIPPTPTTEWEILSEVADGDAVHFHVRYANDTEAIELRTRWEKIGPDWKIVEAHQADISLSNLQESSPLSRPSERLEVRASRRAGFVR